VLDGKSLSTRWGPLNESYIKDDRPEVPSWLTLAEFKQAIAHAEIAIESLPDEYKYVLATMAAAESTLGRVTRIVFWFNS
jgi:hypothetical protein